LDICLRRKGGGRIEKKEENYYHTGSSDSVCFCFDGSPAAKDAGTGENHI
jgi:hypothetical protein